MDNPFKSPVVLSLCTGMRGLERGIERAIGPVRTIAYVETEAFAACNLVQQMEQGVLAPAIVHTNVKTINAEIFRGKIHGVTGGYPCVGESLIGLLKGINDERFLWPDFERIIKASRPVWGFFENVANHLNESFPYVLNSLHTMGYRVEAEIFSAVESGAPHTRERVFILAVDNSHFSGLEGHTWNENGGGKWTGQGRSAPKASVFPMPYGLSQWEWEKPRVNFRDEPGMGTTINGYNFREDLLRMAGNGVVEQTAELAFITLLEKHFNNVNTTTNAQTI